MRAALDGSSRSALRSQRQLFVLDQLRRLSAERVLPVLLNKLRYHAGPSRLMARAQSFAGVAVKILVEQNQVTPVRVVLELGTIAVDRASTFLILEEQCDEPMRELGCDIP